MSFKVVITEGRDPGDECSFVNGPAAQSDTAVTRCYQREMTYGELMDSLRAPASKAFSAQSSATNTKPLPTVGDEIYTRDMPNLG